MSHDVIYFWTLGLKEADEDKGKFYHWAAKSEKWFLKRAKKLYGERPFDYGRTGKETYDHGRKGDHNIILDESQ